MQGQAPKSVQAPAIHCTMAPLTRLGKLVTVCVVIDNALRGCIADELLNGCGCEQGKEVHKLVYAKLGRALAPVGTCCRHLNR